MTKEERESRINELNSFIKVYKNQLEASKENIDLFEREKKELEELNKPKRFKPELDERYFCLGPKGDIIAAYWMMDDFDIFRYKTRNCFKTKEEAEEELERILFVNEVRDFVEEENGDWNYSNNYEDVFLISYEEGVLKYTDWDYRYKHTSDYKYFKSCEIGEKILAKFDNEKLVRWWI